jgi:signal transduction histidine kinase
MTDPLLPRSERQQTDESLRLERDRADGALDDEISDADETADAVISRARARADALLAAARKKTDHTSTGDQPADALKTSRAIEDHILQRERMTADHLLHRERSEHVTLLSQERQATDQDLSHERARSDKALAMRDDFMGIVSHDLLNLLNAMVGISSLIEKEVAQENHVERVVAHARRVQRSRRIDAYGGFLQWSERPRPLRTTTGCPSVLDVAGPTCACQRCQWADGSPRDLPQRQPLPSRTRRWTFMP